MERPLVTPCKPCGGRGYRDRIFLGFYVWYQCLVCRGISSVPTSRAVPIEDAGLGGNVDARSDREVPVA